VQVGSKQLGDEVPANDELLRVRSSIRTAIQVFERRDEDVAQTDDLVQVSRSRHGEWGAMQTFSCRICLRSFSSRYVLLESTGVLKGFIIFFTATDCPVSWSLAELWWGSQSVCFAQLRRAMESHQTRPNAPMPTGCRSVYLRHVKKRLINALRSLRVPAGDLKGGPEDLRPHELRHVDRSN
jgi:hypothetical protein